MLIGTHTELTKEFPSPPGTSRLHIPAQLLKWETSLVNTVEVWSKTIILRPSKRSLEQKLLRAQYALAVNGFNIKYVNDIMTGKTLIRNHG